MPKELDPRVHASIISLAGRWAEILASRAKHNGSRYRFDTLLRKSFDSAYTYLTQTIEEKSQD